MPGHHDIVPFGGRIERQFLSVMDDEESAAEKLHGRRIRDSVSPIIAVYIASDGGNGRDLGELMDDVLPADVTGVDDVVDALQRGHRFGTK